MTDELRRENAKLRSELATAQAERDATWSMIENSFDIETRSYFEEASKTNGFKYALTQAIHHIWKREPKVVELQQDAGRWRAFLNCGRIRIIGSAGFDKKPPIDATLFGHYRHIGLEIWTAFPDEPVDETTKQMLIEFADESAAVAAKAIEDVGGKR